MSLSSQDRCQLHEALIDAFPTTAALEQMLSFGLDKNLREIAEERNLKDIVFNLIKNAEAQEWVENLINAACSENPGNLKLKVIAEKLLINNPLEQKYNTYRTIVTKLVLLNDWMNDPPKLSHMSRQTLNQECLNLQLSPEEANKIVEEVFANCKTFYVETIHKVKIYYQELKESEKLKELNNKFTCELRQELRLLQLSLVLDEKLLDENSEKVIDEIISIIYTKVGNIFINKEELNKAHIVFQEAANFNENNPLVHYGFAAIWFKQKKYAKALGELNKAKQLLIRKEKTEQNKKQAAEIVSYIKNIDLYINTIPISSYLAYQFNTFLRILLFRSTQK